MVALLRWSEGAWFNSFVDWFTRVWLQCFVLPNFVCRVDFLSQLSLLHAEFFEAHLDEGFEKTIVHFRRDQSQAQTTTHPELESGSESLSEAP